MLARPIRLVSILVTVAVIVTGCAGRSPGWTVEPAQSGRPVAAAPSGSAAAGPSSAASTVAATQPGSTPQGEPAANGGAFTIRAFDTGFDPASVHVPTPGKYDVTFENTGTVAHDVTFDDGTKLVAGPAEKVTGTVTVPEGGLGFICSVIGHADAGMRGGVMVDGTAAVPTAAPGSSPAPGSSGAPTPAPSMPPDDHGGPPPLIAGVEPDPAAPAYKLFDATAPVRLSGTEHDIDLVMTEGKMTVAPGYVVDVWTFGGTVPGPVIRVKVGDTVRIHLKNPATNQMSHSIDFHSSQVAWNDEMRSIAPGEELLYEWTADYAGVWMYHCGTAPALHHIANGMYGMVIVEPREGLPAVDHEFALVQSEWYLDGQGLAASLSKAAAGAPSPDLVVFNGVYNQYKDHPLEVATNDRVRFFLLDTGPNIDSSFHIVGTIFDRVMKEGVAMDAATNGGWASQAVDLSPAQGAIIELAPREDGLYPIVTHAFNFVGRGALGLLQAGDGDPTN